MPNVFRGLCSPGWIRGRCFPTALPPSLPHPLFPPRAHSSRASRIGRALVPHTAPRSPSAHPPRAQPAPPPAAKERIIGWYHTGPKLRPGDVNINEVLRQFVPHPILVVVDVVPKKLGLPVQSYVCVEEVHDDGTPTTKTFEHVGSAMGAEEAEEVGVEHLLRDIKDIGMTGSLTDKIQQQQNSLKGLESHLKDIHTYLAKVVAGEIKVNHSISYVLFWLFLAGYGALLVLARARAPSARPPPSSTAPAYRPAAALDPSRRPADLGDAGTCCKT